MNSLRMSVSVIRPKITSGTEGGISTPSTPPEATAPVESRSW